MPSIGHWNTFLKAFQCENIQNKLHFCITVFQIIREALWGHILMNISSGNCSGLNSYKPAYPITSVIKIKEW